MWHSFGGDDDCDGCCKSVSFDQDIVVVIVVILVVFVVKLVVVVVMVIVIMVDLLFPTTTTTTTTNIPTTTSTPHTLKYGTFSDGRNSGLGWVLMSVVVMVGYCW